MKDLVLYGAGGMGREIVRVVERINNVDKSNPVYNLLGFIDDAFPNGGTTKLNVPILGDMNWLLNHKSQVVCSCTIGFPELRKKIIERLIANDVKLETLIDPSAVIDRSTVMGKGCVIQNLVAISTNVTLGDGVFLNSGVGLGHDAVVGNYCVIHTRACVSGACKLGNEVLIGGMAFLNPKVRVQDNAIVAPLSAVYGIVRKNTKVIGNPAHKIEI